MGGIRFDYAIAYTCTYSERRAEHYRKGTGIIKEGMDEKKESTAWGGKGLYAYSEKDTYFGRYCFKLTLNRSKIFTAREEWARERTPEEIKSDVIAKGYSAVSYIQPLIPDFHTIEYVIYSDKCIISIKEVI